MSSQIGAKATIPNQMLKPFEVLLGEWESTGTHPYLPGTLHGRTSFESIEGGAFVLMRTEVDHPKIPDGIAIFGSDDVAGTFHMIYYDERGVSRKYDVSITDAELTWWRNDAHLSQRVTLTIEKDKLVGTGEMSRDGGEWEKDLSLTYTRKS